MDQKNLADEYFNSHPEAEQLFMTADEQFFFDDNNARAHSRGLANKEVTKFTRDGEADELGVDLTTHAVYTPDASLFERHADDLEFIHVVEEKVSGSELEAIEEMTTEKTTVTVTPSQPIPALNEEQKESVAQANADMQESAEQAKEQEGEAVEQAAAIDGKVEEIEQEAEEKKAALKGKVASKTVAKPAPKKSGK